MSHYVSENAAFLSAKADGPNTLLAHSSTQDVFTLVMACNTKSAVISVTNSGSNNTIFPSS
jgi:hypothetical protein